MLRNKDNKADSKTIGGFQLEMAALRRQVASEYDAWSSHYDTDVNPTMELDHFVLRRQNIDFDGKVVVEFGCGTGRHTEWIAPRCERIVAMDISEGMLEVARKRVPEADFRVHDIGDRWPLEDRSADVVFGDLVLEHLENLEPFFAEARRVLKPEGLLFICELHPVKQLLGVKAGRKDGEQNAAPPCFYHDVSDYLSGAVEAGFWLIQFQEWRDKDGLRGNERTQCVPRLMSVLWARGGS